MNTVIHRNPNNQHDVKNHLITHWEHADIKHDGQSTIHYKRINHLDFKYQIYIKNKNKAQQKVIVRLWLGISSDNNDIRLIILINSKLGYLLITVNTIQIQWSKWTDLCTHCQGKQRKQLREIRTKVQRL